MPTHAAFIHTQRQKEYAEAYPSTRPTLAINKCLASFSPCSVLISTIFCLAFLWSSCFFIPQLPPIKSSAYAHSLVLVFYSGLQHRCLISWQHSTHVLTRDSITVFLALDHIFRIYSGLYAFLVFRVEHIWSSSEGLSFSSRTRAVIPYLEDTFLLTWESLW